MVILPPTRELWSLKSQHQCVTETQIRMIPSLKCLEPKVFEVQFFFQILKYYTLATESEHPQAKNSESKMPPNKKFPVVTF